MKSKISITEVQASTIVRLIVLIVALINLGLSVFTDFQIPGLTDTCQQAIATIITAGAAIVGYWYNNSWSENATTADKVLGAVSDADVSMSVEDILAAIEILQSSDNKELDYQEDGD